MSSNRVDFSEYSHGNYSLEEEVLKIAEKYGMKVIGPNCVGTVNFDIKMMMPFAFFKDIPTGGRVGLIVQSGGVGGTYLRAITGYGIKPGKFVATGNKLQLDEVDFLEYLLHDDKTDIVAIYLEGFKRGRAFFDLARQSEKPIIVQKSNRSALSAKIAQSHTTALSGSDEVVDGAFRQAAVVRIEDEIDFINAIKIIRLPLMKGRRVAVLSRSGGHAVLSADACAKYGFEIVPFPPSFIEKLKTIYNTRVIAHQNPLDLGEIFDYTIFTNILEEALKLSTYDGVLFNHLYSSNFEAEMSRTFLTVWKSSWTNIKNRSAWPSFPTVRKFSIFQDSIISYFHLAFGGGLRSSCFANLLRTQGSARCPGQSSVLSC